MNPNQWPSFDSLPLDPNGPPGNAWGLFGPRDQLGMLNLLTPEVVAAAAKEIQQGLRISLDWPLNKPSLPTFTRKQFEHRIIHEEQTPMNDDVVHFNTQSSTQWDGFRHFGVFFFFRLDSRSTNCELAFRSTRQFFNGHIQEDFENPDTLGIDSMSHFLSYPSTI
jgi:hypothetical protein